MASQRPTVRRRSRPRSRWHAVHRWIGVGIGVWFLLVGLTGALLVWRDSIDAQLNPQWFRARTQGPSLDLDRIVEIARSEHRLGRVERIRPPAEPGLALRLQVRAGAGRVESGRLEAFVDPASGALLGARSLESVSLAPPHLMRTVYEFHRNVLLGEPGSNLVGVAGFVLMTAAVSGVVIAWPRSRERWRRLFAVSWRANGARLSLDLHRSCGALLALGLLLSTATGATLVYLNYVRDWVGRVSRVEPIPVLPFRTYAGDARLLTLAQLVERVNRGFPLHRIAEIQLTERGMNGVLFKLHAAGDVHPLGDTIAWMHPVSGELLAERSGRTRSAGESFMHWLLPLHVGSAFGTPGLVAMAAAGLAPLVLLPTGLIVWLRKRWAANRNMRSGE